MQVRAVSLVRLPRMSRRGSQMIRSIDTAARFRWPDAHRQSNRSLSDFITNAYRHRSASASGIAQLRVIRLPAAFLS